MKNFKTVNYRISKSIQFTFILGFIFTSIFIGFSNEIGNLVYKNENIGDILYLLSFTCIFIYLQQTLLGILNGLGKQGVSLRNSTVGYIIRILFVVYFIPVYGVKGYIAGIIVSSACVCVLNTYTVTKMTGMVLDFRNWILKPGVVCTVIIFAHKYINSFFNIFNISGDGAVIANILGNTAVAFGLMFVVGAIDKEEILKLFK